VAHYAASSIPPRRAGPPEAGKRNLFKVNEIIFRTMNKEILNSYGVLIIEGFIYYYKPACCGQVYNS